MSLIKKINPFSKQNNDTGFSTSNNETGGRFLNKDGSFNLVKEGLPYYKRFSIFNNMLSLPLWKFITVIFIFFIIVNLIFAGIYYFIGPQQFDGLVPGCRGWQFYKDIFYFSTQTFTTVGYGHVNPTGDAANMVAGIEALSGFLSLAIATGLIYGRFSKPRSYLMFSEQALVSPYKGGTAIMFRFVGYKDKHTLTDVEIKVNTGMLVSESGKTDYKYFTLALERSRVETLPMSWTVVHPIDENSPFFGFAEADMKTADVELYINIRGYDDVFSNIVQHRTSYTYNEIVFNRRFMPMYHESEDGKTTVMELHKLNEHTDTKTAAPNA